ncbi:MAG: sigma-70 family RNA polymerase sigma factor [Bacillota bacterium]|nr:sigma-70 family RNA polymerase sigma factor [Bacillota bacterium]
MDRDKKIVEGILKHNEKAFELFIDVYGGLIKSIVKYHMSAFTEYQSDCINDILLSIWQNMKSYDESKNSLNNWVGAVCKYKCIDYKRKNYENFRFDELDENIPYDKDDFNNVLESEIQSILYCLEPKDRELFYKHYILGEKINEIAKKENKSPDYFFNRLSRGRKKLSQNLQRSDFYEK